MSWKNVNRGREIVEQSWKGKALLSHVGQPQVSSDCERWLYSASLTLAHFAWHQSWHTSHWIPFWFLRTGKEQALQGYLTGLGLDSMSPAARINPSMISALMGKAENWFWRWCLRPLIDSQLHNSKKRDKQTAEKEIAVQEQIDNLGIQLRLYSSKELSPLLAGWQNNRGLDDARLRRRHQQKERPTEEKLRVLHDWTVRWWMADGVDGDGNMALSYVELPPPKQLACTNKAMT